MRLNVERLALILLALAAAGAAAVLGTAISNHAPQREADARQRQKLVSVRTAAEDPVAVRIGRTAVVGPPPRSVVMTEATTNLQVEVREEDDEIDRLYEQTVVELLSEMESSVAAKDLTRLRQLVDRYRQLTTDSKASSGRRRGLSSSSKRKLLDALGALGFEGLDLVIDSLGDSDPVIVSDATERIFDALQDPTLGDYRRAEIVVAAASEMTQRHSLVQLLNECIRMRNSVRVEALSQIYSAGTPEAKVLLPRTMGAVTGDVETQTPQQLDEWLADNPDSPDDDRIYGPKTPQKSTGDK